MITPMSEEHHQIVLSALQEHIEGRLIGNFEDLTEEQRQLLQEHLRTTVREEIEEFFKSHQAKRKMPPIPDVFSTGRALVSSAQPMQGVTLAIQNVVSGGDRWQYPDGNPPFYVHEKGIGTTIIEYMRDRNEILDDKATSSLRKQLGESKEEDTDNLFIVMAHCIKSQEKDGSTWIFASPSLDYKDKQPIMKRDTPSGKPRRAGHRQEDKRAFGESIGRLSGFWLTIDQFIYEEATTSKKKQGKKKQYTHQGRIFTIEEVWLQRELDPESDAPNMPVGWRIRPGAWLQTFLGQRHVAYLCDKTLKYHPLREKWEKRLSTYIMLHFRMNGGGRSGGKYTREIGPLLTELSLPVNRRDPDRTKQRLEQAMNQLVKDSHIDAWEYAEKIDYKSKKWIATWLTNKAVIYIAPSAK